jgi:branched-chain amino acid transport system permease protein
MDGLLLQQLLNGVQLGVMLFLLAAGLTLIFGIMDFINLAHGSLYMVGAYLTAHVTAATGSFMVGLLAAIVVTALVGVIVERIASLGLYERDHLFQVLATFGLILFFNEAIALIFGPLPVFLDPPDWLAGQISLFGAPYPAIRLAIIVAGLAVALFLWWLIARTRFGMLLRAGASNRPMLRMLGVRAGLLFAGVFALAGALAALAGGFAGSILGVRIGMGEEILILTFVVIVIGGIGSIKGAFFGALIIGLADTLGRAFLPGVIGAVMEGPAADALGASLASIFIYLVMAAILAVRPRGLFAT